MADQDTPGQKPLHPLNPQGPVPELNCSEMEFQISSILHSHSANINNNKMPRTSEPDNDDCAQPEQLHRRLEESVRDNSTIMSQRTGTDTLDTEQTIQRGSRSKKPSPDPDVQPQPRVRMHVPGAVEQSPNENGKKMPSSLSFPSPPSVNDEELPTQKTSSACGGSHNGGGSASAHEVHEMIESLSSSSYGKHEDRRNSNNKTESSSKKRLYLVVVSLVVLVIVIVVALKVTKGDGKSNATKHPDKDLPHSGHADASILIPSAAPSPLLEQLELNTSHAPSPEPTAVGLDDIILVSSNVGSLNQTQSDDDEFDDSEGTSSLVPVEEESTASPSMYQSAPTPTPSLRGPS